MAYQKLYDKENVKQRIIELSDIKDLDGNNISKEDLRIIAWAKRYYREDSDIVKRTKQIRRIKDNSITDRITKKKKKRKESRNQERIKLLKNLDENNNYGYYELIELFSNDLRWSTKYLKDTESVDRVNRIRLKSLKKSIKKISKTEPINSHYISKNYPGLEKMAKYLYMDDKKPWIAFLRDCNLEDKINIYESWNLKKVLGKIKELGSNLAEIKGKKKKMNCTKLVNATKNYAGSFGKGVILTGIDYTKIPTKGISKKNYHFSDEELLRIINDKSIDEKEKAYCVFNVLSLQYYDLSVYRSTVSRITDHDSSSKLSLELTHRFLKKRKMKSFKLNITTSYSENKDLFKVGIDLENNIDNPFHETGFYFSNDLESNLEAMGFYIKINSILTDLSSDFYMKEVDQYDKRKGWNKDF